MNTINTFINQESERLLDGDGKLSAKERQSLQEFVKNTDVHKYMISHLENIGVKDYLVKNTINNAERTALVQLYLRLKGENIAIDGDRGKQTEGAARKIAGRKVDAKGLGKIAKEYNFVETLKYNEQQRIEVARNTLSQWYEPHIVDGMIGNLMIESRLNPQAVGDSGKAHGIAQRHGDRERRLIKKGFATRTLEGGLGAIHYELDNYETKAKEKLLASNTAEEAAKNFDKYYERSNGKSRSERVAYAKQLNKQPYNTQPEKNTNYYVSGEQIDTKKNT